MANVMSNVFQFFWVLMSSDVSVYRYLRVRYLKSFQILEETNISCLLKKQTKPKQQQQQQQNKTKTKTNKQKQKQTNKQTNKAK